jgi:adhesin HecA-like repeat protein
MQFSIDATLLPEAMVVAGDNGSLTAARVLTVRAGLYSARSGVAISTEPAFTVSAHPGDDPWQEMSGGD